MSGAQTATPAAGAEATEGVSILDQVIGATKQTTPDQTQDLMKTLVEQAMSGTVTFDGANSFTTEAGTSPIGSGATAVEALPIETTTSALDGDVDGFNVCTWAVSCSPSPS